MKNIWGTRPKYSNHENETPSILFPQELSLDKKSTNCENIESI